MAKSSQPKARFYTRVSEQDFSVLLYGVGKPTPPRKSSSFRLDEETKMIGRLLDD